jgi:hypothetical protein
MQWVTRRQRNQISLPSMQWNKRQMTRTLHKTKETKQKHNTHTRNHSSQF